MKPGARKSLSGHKTLCLGEVLWWEGFSNLPTAFHESDFTSSWRIRAFWLVSRFFTKEIYLRIVAELMCLWARGGSRVCSSAILLKVFSLFQFHTYWDNTKILHKSRVHHYNRMQCKQCHLLVYLVDCMKAWNRGEKKVTKGEASQLLKLSCVFIRVVSYCNLICIFLISKDIEHSFMYLMDYLYIFFEEMSLQF